MLYCCLVVFSKIDTYAWFTSESIATGSIVNATTRDLLSIIPGPISYEKNCKVRQDVTITNISDFNITVQIENFKRDLSPNETFTANLNINNLPHQCETTTLNFHLTALNGYIDEFINVSLDPSRLLATVEEKKKTDEAKPAEEESHNEGTTAPPGKTENSQTGNENNDPKQDLPEESANDQPAENNDQLSGESESESNEETSSDATDVQEEATTDAP